MKIERSIYVRNMNGKFNKKGPIEHTVEINGNTVAYSPQF